MAGCKRSASAASLREDHAPPKIPRVHKAVNAVDYSDSERDLEDIGGPSTEDVTVSDQSQTPFADLCEQGPPRRRHLLRSLPNSSSLNTENKDMHEASTSSRKKTPGPTPPNPTAPRQLASLGQENLALLQIPVIDWTGKPRTLRFPRADEVDWNSQAWIKKINIWSSGIYRRHHRAETGITRSEYFWHEDENAWIELWVCRLAARAVKDHEGWKLPKSRHALAQFNGIFTGAVLSVEDGGQLPPRPSRAHRAFDAKYHRIQPKLQAQLQTVMQGAGKGAEVYCPDVTLDMVAAYKGIKSRLVDSLTARGIGADTNNFSVDLEKLMSTQVSGLADERNDEAVSNVWQAFFDDIANIHTTGTSAKSASSVSYSTHKHSKEPAENHTTSEDLEIEDSRQPQLEVMEDVSDDHVNSEYESRPVVKKSKKTVIKVVYGWTCFTCVE